jgi:DNA-directed RNA polymerase subunit E'/Rpb7
MDNNDIFVRTLLSDKVKMQPRFITSSLQQQLLKSLKNKFEGMCSYHGYIKPQSIAIFKCSLGYIQALSLNGDVEYIVNYYADVCNPSIGSIVHTKVVNTNRFGILTQTGYTDPAGSFVPVLEIVVAKNMTNHTNDQNVDEITIGDELHVEITGKKFELTDKKISAIARIIDTDEDKNILDIPLVDNPIDEVVVETDDTDDSDSESVKDSSEDDDEEPDEVVVDEESVDADDESIASEGFFSDNEAASDFGDGSGSDGEVDD